MNECSEIYPKNPPEKSIWDRVADRFVNFQLIWIHSHKETACIDSFCDIFHSGPNLVLHTNAFNFVPFPPSNVLFFALTMLKISSYITFTTRSIPLYRIRNATSTKSLPLCYFSGSIIKSSIARENYIKSVPALQNIQTIVIARWLPIFVPTSLPEVSTLER